MSFTPEAIEKELKAIQAQVPSIIRNKIVIEAELTPTIKKIAEEFLASGSKREDLKKHLKLLLDSGQLSKPKYSEDPKYAKMATSIVNRLIKKSIREGRLPRKVDYKSFLKK